MQNPWQALLEDLWPSRSVPSELLWRRKALLHTAIALVIALAAGPEIIAAIEMTTLLELLGASLFLAAFRAGATLVAVGAQTVLFSFVYSMLGIRRRSSHVARSSECM